MHIYPIIKKIHSYIENVSPFKYNFVFVLSNIRMMNLSLYELRQIAKGRNISDYENKSEEDLKKAIIETKPEPEPKQTPNPETKPQPTPKARNKTRNKTKTNIKTTTKTRNKIRIKTRNKN